MNVQKYTNEQILDRLPHCAGWQGLPDNGVLDVWVRSNEDAFDKFDDKVYTFEITNGVPRFIMVCSGTSNAGAEGLKHFDKYNREGCAILDGDRIVYNSHAYGLHKGKYPAYRQVRPFPYYRDNDKDNRAEEIGEQHDDIIGANCHKAGWYSTAIGGWSVACLVRNVQAEYDKWMRFMNRRPLTVAILNEWTPAMDEKPRLLSDEEVSQTVQQIREVPARTIEQQPQPRDVVVKVTAETDEASGNIDQLQRQLDRLPAETRGEALCKERPSTFVKIGTGLTGGIGVITGLGVNLQSLFDRAASGITLQHVLTLVIGLGLVALAIWLYDRSAKRANALNVAKIEAAADRTKNTVEFRN